MEKAQASNSHQKILKHSFFLFVFLLILGSLLLIVGLYTEVSDTWKNIEDIIHTKGKSLFDNFSGSNTKKKVLRITAISGAIILILDAFLFLWIIFLTIKKLLFKSS